MDAMTRRYTKFKPALPEIFEFARQHKRRPIARHCNLTYLDGLVGERSGSVLDGHAAPLAPFRGRDLQFLTDFFGQPEMAGALAEVDTILQRYQQSQSYAHSSLRSLLAEFQDSFS
ncbi:MAG: hypothetical protein AAGF24_06310 [Cyanobacteria bacterium P01_H01_bin.121]